MSSIGNHLAKDSHKSEYFKELYVKLIKSYSFNLKVSNEIINFNDKETEDLLRFADIFSNSSEPEDRNKAFQLISLMQPLSHFKDSANFQLVAYAVFVKLGLFINCSEKYIGENIKLPNDRTFEEEFKRGIQSVENTDKIFTDAQFELFKRMTKNIFFSYSAPTSMGKSFLIQRFIEQTIRKNKKNIIVIVPTRALINQFSLEIKKEQGELLEKNSYRVLTNSNVSQIEIENNKNFIFVLTPERLVSLLSQKEIKTKQILIDILFVDEAHKLAEDSERSVTEYNAISLFIEQYPDAWIYFASPNIKNPETYLNLFNKPEQFSFVTTEAPVSQNLYFIDFVEKKVHYYSENIELETNIFNESDNIESAIYNLGKNTKSNLVYCSRPDKAVKMALHFSGIPELEDIIDNKDLDNAIKKIKNYIHDDYYPALFLKKGLAFHHGKLPQIIRNIIEDLFTNGHIKFIFCTSTLLEGINMPTRNIFIRPDNKLQLIESSSKQVQSNVKTNFWNLAGRAGRYSKELSGNIFCFQDNQEGNKWKDTKIFNKGVVTIYPTVQERINKKIKDIERLLKEEPKKGTQERIIEQIANIMVIDNLKFPDDVSLSPILKKFLENHKEIIELAKVKAENFKKNIPLDILKTNTSINLNIQKDIFLKVKNNPEEFKISQNMTDEFLFKMWDLYDWEKYLDHGKEVKNKEHLKYLRGLMNKWISGFSLKDIILDAIKYKTKFPENIEINEEQQDDNDSYRYKIKLSFSEPWVDFDKNNENHINRVINEILSNIENILRYTFEKYFNHLYQILLAVYKGDETKAGQNWAAYLEYGSKFSEVFALQNLGLSRYTANILMDKNKGFKKYFKFDGKKLISYDKKGLLKNIDKDSLEYEEISKLL